MQSELPAPSPEATYVLPCEDTVQVRPQASLRHWQLRSQLCSPSADSLYYPSNNRIYYLNTATKKRRLVASLPFSPRCIGARYGWICAGGNEHGNFATIRIRRTEEEEFGRAGDDLPVSMDGEASDEEERRASGRPTVTVKKLGGSIVNSVTLHRPPSSTSDDDVLAVLTYRRSFPRLKNNDKTVRIFHLAQNRVVTTLHVAAPTNHASISPDGQHLVVVGDVPEVYFYHPASSGSYNDSSNTGIGEAGCGSWILSSHPPLKAGDDGDALMSTSFSPSSLHCAVASQTGIITIFDTRYLSCTHPDGISPLVKRITSSRAYTHVGAIRSVQFSPAPWDLLVWAEHCGRVCVADARSNFTRRQIVNIFVEKDELIEAEIEEMPDLPSAWEISQSLLGNPNTNRAVVHEEGETIDDSDSPDLRRASSASINEMANLILENSVEWHPYTSRARGSGTGSNYQSVVNSAGSSLPASTPSLLRDHRESQIERERARNRIHDPPRRRNSVHPSYADQINSIIGNETMAAYHAHEEQLHAGIMRTVAEARLVARPRDSMVANLIADQRRRNRRSGRLESQTNPLNTQRSESDGVDITGCTFSPNGRKLFVAIDSGVIEYVVDVGGRKVFPSIKPR
ncbi:hypothetical protein EDC01DRAFT_763353 [Geopyxis carbonaria]|nr:hypothetical protein EDC01DRAFT_763353 [Geopyxis carbonaria]